MKVRLIMLSLCFMWVVTGTDLPSVHVKSSLSFHRPDRALLDIPPLSSAMSLVAPFRQLATSGLELSFQPELQQPDRSLTSEQELQTMRTDLLAKLTDLTYSATMKFEFSNLVPTHIIGFWNNETLLQPLVEIFIDQIKLSDTITREFVVLQNWILKDADDNANKIKEIFAANRSNHKYFKRSLVRKISEDESLSTYLQNSINDYLSFLTDPKEKKQGEKPSERMSSVEEVAAALAGLIPTQKLTLEGPALTPANGPAKAVVYVAHIKQGNAKEFGQLDRPAFHFVVWQADLETARAVFTGLDQEVEFKVNLRGFDTLKDPSLEHVKKAFVDQDWASKLSLANIQGLINESLGNCKDKQNGNAFGARTKTYQALLYSFEDTANCFAARSNLAVLRLSSGAIQFAHLRFTCPYFHTEYIVPCVQASFQGQIVQMVAELKEVINDVQTDHKNSQSDVTTEFSTIEEIVGTAPLSAKLVAEKTNAPGTVGWSGTGLNGEVKIRVTLVGQVYKISLSWASAKELLGTFGTEISFPKINSYSPKVHIEKQIAKFLAKRESLLTQK